MPVDERKTATKMLRFVARFPWVAALAVLVGVSVLAGTAFRLVEWPDFSEDPVKGFETRGTQVSGALRAVGHLSTALTKGELSYLPPANSLVITRNDDSGVDSGQDEEEEEDGGDLGEDSSVTQSPDDNSTSYDYTVETTPEMATDTREYHYEASHQTEPPVVNGLFRRRRKREARMSDCRVDWIGSWIYPKVVFSAKGGHSLLSAAAIREMCQVDDEYIRYYSQWNRYNCPSHSLAYYIRFLSSKACQDITDLDVEELLNLLRDCSEPYAQGKLKSRCSSVESCRNDTPEKCHQYNAVYHIFEFLTDKEFFTSVRNSQKNSEVQLRYTAMFVSYVHGDDVLDLFESSLEAAVDRNWQTVDIAGIDIGDSKYSLFEKYLMEDIVYFALAAVLIVAVMVLYLRSVVITVATMLNVGFSFLLAYFIYHIVCGFNFFPFLNLLSILVLLGVGADDVFIFVDVWYQEKQKQGSDAETNMADHLHRTLKHALLTVFVTSLTTSAAFFSNAISSITAVRCFAIFAGIAIMANFLFMVTWFPAVLVMVEWLTTFASRQQVHFAFCFGERKCINFAKRLFDLPGRFLNILFNKYLPFLINRLWFVWLFVLSGLGVAGLVLVLYEPKLSLPSSGTFQLFHSDHPLERFEMKLVDQFFYSDSDSEDDYSGTGMRAAYIWGVKATDNGNHVNPDSDGHLVYDKQFNLSSPEAQVWMKNYCESVRENASFLSDYSRQDFCLMTFFERALSRPCSLLPSQYSHYLDCCERTFPVPAAKFKKCFAIFVRFYDSFLASGPMDYPLFDREGDIGVYLLDFWTNQTYSTSYAVMGDFSDSLNGFLDRGLEEAPSALKGGWLYGDLGFYDLQRALSIGTYIAFGMSLGVSLVVIFLTSLNLVLSLYAVITIGFSIAVTVGVLVLLGWELNILESITLSLAIGLSIDFSIHYAVAYRLCDSDCQSERVTYALGRVGPAILMATLTTFLAGAAIMGTRILAYTQLGTFLMITMVVSWLFATFFFLPLCSVAGPRGNCAQIRCPPKKCEERSTAAVSSECTRF